MFRKAMAVCSGGCTTGGGGGKAPVMAVMAGTAGAAAAASASALALASASLVEKLVTKCKWAYSSVSQMTIVETCGNYRSLEIGVNDSNSLLSIGMTCLDTGCMIQVQPVFPASACKQAMPATKPPKSPQTKAPSVHTATATLNQTIHSTYGHEKGQTELHDIKTSKNGFHVPDARCFLSFGLSLDLGFGFFDCLRRFRSDLLPM